MIRALFTITIVMALSACVSTPSVTKTESSRTAIPNAIVSLPDKTVFNQKDPQWAHHPLGHTSDNLGTDGCLVTATAMALGNLGFETTPADLNHRLTSHQSFTPKGWLIWSGIGKVTEGRAEARYYDDVSADIIDSCMRDGYYPLAQFYLPNGRSHWSMIVAKSKQGYHMRDPLRVSKSPLVFPRSADSFRAVRCVGLTDRA